MWRRLSGGSGAGWGPLRIRCSCCFSGLEVGWGVFTPQGDAVNDQLSIQYTLYRVQKESQVKVGIYALDGQLMWQVLPEPRAAGRHTVQWDGRERNGALVGPGVYLARVEVKTDKGSEVRMQTVSVVY